jgi:NADP-dependent aldehyde dehydrogenase
MNVSGPWPSDTVFLKAKRGEVDAVVTMYHDQGQIAIKLLGFERGVTVAGGLPLPIATPAHGTAFDIAGQNKANVSAIRQAFNLLLRMAKTHREVSEKNGLKLTPFMQKEITVLQGKNLINGQWVGSEDSAASVDLASISFAQANLDQVEEACKAARAAFRSYSQKSRAERADFLNKIADEIDVLADQITNIGTRETGLPEARLIGERGRTTGQLRMFAAVIESKDYLDIRIDQALPDRQPMPRPDIRLTHRALGPVVVFGASNFPLAFSAAGGDTASALAAGCPVIVKGHSAHAGTAELVGQAIANAIRACNMPRGTFQLLQGSGRKIGGALVQHPEITAVGFTGSTAGGRVLYDMCHSRPKPIPFYGELGSVNPVFCLPKAMAQRAIGIGKDWAASLSMGAGQFCTNPGVVLAIKGHSFTSLQNAAVTVLNAGPEQKNAH